MAVGPLEHSTTAPRARVAGRGVALPRVAVPARGQSRAWPLFLTILAPLLVGAGWGLGYVATLDTVALPKLMVILLGIASVPLLALHADLAAIVFLGVLWARISDLAVELYGAPSLAFPFGLFLIVLALERRFARNEGTRWREFSYLAAITPYVAVVLLSITWSEYPGRAIDRSADLLKNVLIFGILVYMFRRRRSTLRGALWGLVITAGILSAVNAHQYFTRNFLFDYGGLARTQIQNIVGAQNDYRLGGPLGEPNYFALLLVITVPIGLGLLRTHVNLVQRLLLWALVGVTALTIVLTFSRGGTLILGLAVLLSLPRHRVRPAVALALLAVAVPLAVVLTPASVWDRMGTLLDPIAGNEPVGRVIDQSVELRLGAQQVAIEMFITYPLQGVGIANYSPLYQTYAEKLGIAVTASGEFNPHNLYLEILSETGVLGMAAFGLLALTPILALIRGFRSTAPATDAERDWRELQYGVLFGFVVYLAGSFLLHAGYARYQWMVLAVIVSAVGEDGPASARQWIHNNAWHVPRLRNILGHYGLAPEQPSTALRVAPPLARASRLDDRGRGAGARAT